MAVSKNPTPPRREDHPKSRGIPTKALTLCGMPVHATSRGAIPLAEIQAVRAAVLAGKLPTPGEVEAFSAWTAGTIPTPRWDAAPISEAA